MCQKVKVIFLKELRELLRDKVSLVAVFLVPVILLLIFGYGINLDVDHVRFAVLDYDNSFLSRKLVSDFSSNKEYFDFKGYVNSEKDIDRILSLERINFGIIVPSNFERDIKSGKDAHFQVLIDGTFPYRAEVIKSYVKAVAEKLNLSRLPFKVPLKLQTRYWFNESLKQVNITVPGTLAEILMIVPAVFASLLVAKEKESGSIYNFYSSPTSKAEFIIAKQLFAFFISIIVFFILFFMTIFLFKTPFKGSFSSFLIDSLIFLLVSVSFGTFMSSFFKTQVTAFIGTVILTVVPSVLYSGYLTPVSAMSKTGLIVAHIVPTFYYMELIKGYYLKGLSIFDLLSETLILIMFYIFFTALTLLTFKKRQP